MKNASWQRCGPACRAVCIVLGIVAGQAILYGPSLTGSRILLPLDLLATPNTYAPQTAEMRVIVPHDRILSDLVFFYEPARRFAVEELGEGRLPFWSPNSFAGTPCYRWNVSPTHLPGYWIASPRVLAWCQMLVALVAGGGAYAFFRRVLGVGFWPAAFCAWCYPVTGAFVIWQGFWLTSVMCWLPWLLLAVDSAIQRPGGWGGPSVLAFTAIALLGGAPDIAGQALLASGIYGLWRYIDTYWGDWFAWRSWRSVLCVAAAWLFGILAAAWLLLPLMEYASTGARGISRSEGTEERPPTGLEALPQVVIPEIYGSTRNGSFRITSTNEQESSIGGYAGLLASLFAAPLAWLSRRHRSMCACWVLLAFVGLSWSLDVPGMVQLMRLPGMNLMSHARFVFVTAFAILAMAAIGLDALWQGSVSGRWWFLAASVCLAGLSAWCLHRASFLPEPIATELQGALLAGQAVVGVPSLAALHGVQRTFACSMALAGGLSAVGAAGWCWLWYHNRTRRWLPVAAGLLMVGEVFWFAYGRAPQCDPALYYPAIPVLEKLAAEPTERILGCNCLPANLGQVCHLSDVRGYDGVEPKRMTELLVAAADPRSNRLSYAQTQWLAPRGEIARPGKIVLSPILDMLNVRHVVFRGTPAPGIQPADASFDYWVLRNTEAMPRAYVPERVALVQDDHERLTELASPQFNPRRVAYVEEPIGFERPCRGSVTLLDENAGHVALAIDMQTPGLVVLADQWDPGWKAYLDGRETPILRVNHALRGVAVPAGRGTLRFCYEPASLRLGARLSGLAFLAWLAWCLGVFGARRFVIASRPIFETGMAEVPYALRSRA